MRHLDSEKRPGLSRQEDNRTAEASTYYGLPASFQDTDLKLLYAPVRGERLTEHAEYCYLGHADRGEQHEHHVALSSIPNDFIDAGVRVFINHFDDDGNIGDGLVLRFSSVGCLRNYAAWLTAQADRLPTHAESHHDSEVDHG
ncbi:hypothetical protein [Nesterenkonia ebinurensis]|uniref:hypothetical protein n=1 Tax=Nesterenkonia ebinurensis TaxID=2608252 RepID=UPI00123DABCA|nr:hypothetical protein [Nesterenkonia ebinurensis]